MGVGWPLSWDGGWVLVVREIDLGLVVAGGR